MRIIAGSARGRKLEEFKNSDIRPTADRVREALFSMLGEDVLDKVILDLYAGSGALGIEALSRGAKKVCFVDKDIKVVKANLENLGFSKQAEVIKACVFNVTKRFFKNNKKFDIIFMDAPYNDFDINDLKKLEISGILSTKGILIIEYLAELDLEKDIENLTCFKCKKYGKTGISFYGKKVENGR
jgi:16S rRNA (guanine966-N2)-methyltransferase